MDAYPKRPRFFANRFVRLMAKSCLAQEIGPDACWLLSVVVLTEDAKGYRGEVTFFNEQLMPMAGFGSVDSLARARTKAIKAGWLHYTAGGKGRAGRYWVTIPAHYFDTDDAPSDEGSDSIYHRRNAEINPEIPPQKCGTNPEECAEPTARQPGGMCGDNPEECAEHSSLPKTTLPKEKKKLAVSPEEIPLPESINTDRMRQAIAEWFAYRREINRPLKSATSWKAQLDNFAAMGVDRAIQAIRQSIANSWLGIFEPKANGHGKAHSQEQHMIDQINEAMR